jgi:hypothetical protein
MKIMVRSRRIAVVATMLVLCSITFAFLPRSLCLLQFPELYASKQVDRSAAYANETVDVTIEVRGLGSPASYPKALDIVFLLDTSESYIQEKEIVENLIFNTVLSLNNSDIDAMVGFVPFGNYPIYLGGSPVNTDGSVNTTIAKQLTEDFSSILNFMNSTKPVGDWEPWGDAIWVANHWMSWRSSVLKVVVLATDEPCNEGRVVPGPLSRTNGGYYDGSLLWDEVAFAASNDIIYITICDSSNYADLTITQLESVAQITGGVTLNFSELVSHSLVDFLESEVEEFQQKMTFDTAGFDIAVVDTVDPRVQIVPGSYNIAPTSETHNQDGSVTLVWNLGDMKYNEMTTITYKVKMTTCGTVSVNVNAHVDYLDWKYEASSILLDETMVTVYSPKVESCDDVGTGKNVFNVSDAVYAKGTGYIPSSDCSLYIVSDRNWTDGMTISGSAINVDSDASGNILPTDLLNPPLSLGKYDIVVDVNGNGVYDEGIDALHENVEVTEIVIPEYQLFVMPIFMIALLLVAVLSRKVKLSTKP